MVMNSFILRFFIRIWESILCLYNESLIGKIVDRISDGVANLLRNSLLLSFFIKPMNQKFIENSYIISVFRKLKQGYMNGFGKSVQLWFSNSVVMRLLGKMNIYYLLVLLLIVSMIFLPTSLSMIISAGVVIFYIYDWLMGKHTNSKMTLVGFLMGMFLIVMIVSVATAISIKDSAMIAAIYIAFLMALLTLKSAINDAKKLLVILDVLMVVLILACLYGFYQYIIGVEVDAAWVDEEMFGSIGTRVYSFFGNPNMFGVYLVMMVPIAGALLFSTDHWLRRLIYLFAFGVGMVNIALTFSRGSMISVVFAIGIMLLFVDKRFIFVVLAGIAASPFLLPASILQRLMSVGNMQETSSAYRVSIYSAAIDMIRDFFFGGVGLGGFSKVYFAYAYSASKAFHAHNTFLMIFIELGIVGFAIFIVFLVMWVRSLLSTYFQSTNTRHRLLILACVGGIAGASLQGLVEHIWFNSDVLFFYWLVIIVGLIATKLENENEVTHG